MTDSNELHLQSSIKVGEERTKLLEQWIKLQIQPKPFWIPDFLWRRIIGRVLLIVVKETDETKEVEQW